MSRSLVDRRGGLLTTKRRGGLTKFTAAWFSGLVLVHVFLHRFIMHKVGLPVSWLPEEIALAFITYPLPRRIRGFVWSQWKQFGRRIGRNHRVKRWAREQRALGMR